MQNLRANVQMAFLAALTFLNFTSSTAARQKPCTKQQEMQAENGIDHLNDWSAVYQSFKRYSHCDDGAIAEGYSDAIGKLLADNWKTDFPELARLTANDLPFRRFVLRHLDETIPVDTRERVVQNSKIHCPSGAARLCMQITTAASH